MDSIIIKSGQKRVAINNDPERVITFNPTDIVFAEKFYRLLSDFQEKVKSYEAQAREIEAVTELDENELPVNLEQRIALLREVCEYMAGKIDYLFGPGTAQKISDGAIDIDVYEQFFVGITPFIQQARADKVKRYSAKSKRR